MEHKKTYNAKELKTPHGDLSSKALFLQKKLAGYEFHEDLSCFSSACTAT